MIFFKIYFSCSLSRVATKFSQWLSVVFYGVVCSYYVASLSDLLGFSVIPFATLLNF